MKKRVFVVGVMAVLSSMLLQAQSPIPDMSPFIGAWKVNLRNSTYFPGARPAATQQRQYVDRGNGVIAEIRINLVPTGVTALNNVWSGKFDGKDTPVYSQGRLLALVSPETAAPAAPAATPETPPQVSTRSYKVIDANTLEQTNKTGANITSTATVVVSGDGKTLTETVKNFNQKGQQVARNVIVYDRQ